MNYVCPSKKEEKLFFCGKHINLSLTPVETLIKDGRHRIKKKKRQGSYYFLSVWFRMFSAGITNWMFVAVFLSCKILVAAELLEKYYDFSAVQGLQIFDVPANARREIEVTVTGASSGFGLCENSPMYKNGKRITAKINIQPLLRNFT